MAKEHPAREQLIRDLSTILGYHTHLGIRTYPDSQELHTFLQRVPNNIRIDTGPLAAIRPGRRQKKTEMVENVDLRLADIEEEISLCHACPLHLERIFPVVGEDSTKVRLLVVGDWLVVPPGDERVVTRKFGEEEDRMLSRMFAAIALPRHSTYVTNVIKCALPENQQRPTAENIEICLSHLKRQIKALKPEVICAMGVVAAKVLLNKTQPLSALRGCFHDCLVHENWKVPLLATYHPEYLLKNPEMKKAAWGDLQMLAKKMGLMS